MCPDGDVYVGMCFAVRFVEALGASAFYTASFAIIADIFPDNVAVMFVSKVEFDSSYPLPSSLTLSLKTPVLSSCRGSEYNPLTWLNWENCIEGELLYMLAKNLISGSSNTFQEERCLLMSYQGKRRSIALPPALTLESTAITIIMQG